MSAVPTAVVQPWPWHCTCTSASPFSPWFCPSDSSRSVLSSVRNARLCVRSRGIRGLPSFVSLPSSHSSALPVFQCLKRSCADSLLFEVRGRIQSPFLPHSWKQALFPSLVFEDSYWGVVGWPVWWWTSSLCPDRGGKAFCFSVFHFLCFFLGWLVWGFVLDRIRNFCHFVRFFFIL